MTDTSVLADRAATAADRPSRADDVYQQLKRDVSDFKLVPGDRFTETEISERLGVSRTPVRQALFKLQQEGFVEVMFRSGWRVLPFDFDRFEELYDLRMVMDGRGLQHHAQVVQFFKPIKVKRQHAPATPEQHFDKTFLLQFEQRVPHGRA